jgi:hypothetical protein
VGQAFPSAYLPVEWPVEWENLFGGKFWHWNSEMMLRFISYCILDAILMLFRLHFGQRVRLMSIYTSG